MILINDIFTDANGTSLDAHVIAPVNIPGASWNLNGGVATIQGNQVQLGGASVSINTGLPNGLFSFAWTLFADNASPQFRVFIKYIDDNNVIFGDFNLLTNTMPFYVVTGGVSVQFGAFTPQDIITQNGVFSFQIKIKPGLSFSCIFYYQGKSFGQFNTMPSIFDACTSYGFGGAGANKIDNFIFYGAGPSSGHAQAKLLITGNGRSGE